MIALIQRVTEAKVVVNSKKIAEIEQGVLVFLAVEKNDNEPCVKNLVNKVLSYRIFSDSEDKMNLSVQNIQGGVLLVPQFTLAANTKKGCRPSFSSAAAPERAETLFNEFVQQAKSQYQYIETGQFGADMKISLLNDGPVTFWLQV